MMIFSIIFLTSSETSSERERAHKLKPLRRVNQMFAALNIQYEINAHQPTKNFDKHLSLILSLSTLNSKLSF